MAASGVGLVPRGNMNEVDRLQRGGRLRAANDAETMGQKRSPRGAEGEEARLTRGPVDSTEKLYRSRILTTLCLRHMRQVKVMCCGILGGIRLGMVCPWWCHLEVAT